MAITYEIQIQKAEVQNENELTNIIKELTITLIGKEDTYQFSMPLFIKLGPVDKSSFIPFENLTQEELISWIDLDEEQFTGHKQHIAKEIERMRSTKTFPWAPTL